MSKITVYDSEYITVEYWPDNELIYHVIHQPMSDQVAVFKEALNAGTDALKKYKVCKWLSDDRKNDTLTQEGNEWSINDWQPRTLQAGWKYWANVVPQDLAAAGTLAPVIDILFNLGLRMMVFTAVEPAIEWLDKMKAPSA
ncbi:MAG: hypothetical protein JXQ72_16670 [Anaerolineae bacterium]|nr:hypothetical protein [Anaerolineae bacterium]